MDAKLKQESIQQYLCVFSHTVSWEETAESVVPDTMPDIVQILDTDCAVYLRAKNIQNGKAVVEAFLQAAVIYLGEGTDGICKLEITKPLSVTLENDVLAEKDVLFVSLAVNGADTRILNPRKVLLRSDIRGEVSAYRLDELSLPVDRDEGEELQILKAECPMQIIKSVGEKSFSVSEEYTLSKAHGGNVEILTAKSWATIEETKPVGEKIILQGTVGVKLLYRSGEEATPNSEIFTTGFSQIMDCAENADGPNTVLLMPTALNLEVVTGGGGTTVVLMDIHLTAQTICRSRSQLRYIADAYSLCCKESVKMESVQIFTDGETMVLRDTLRTVLETTDAVAEILEGHVCPGQPTVGEHGIRIPVNTKILYRTENGEIGSVNRRLQAELDCDVLRDKKVCFCLPRCPEGYYAPTSGGVEVRLPVEQRLELYEENKVSYVKSVDMEYEEESTDSVGPSLVVVRCQDTDLWTLAKRYKTTTDRIEGANKNSVELGRMLLIPRPR